MEGFRVRVSLSAYFGDERARVLLWIGDEERRTATVACLEARLRKMFAISTPFCLLTSDTLLPSVEPLLLLTADDDLAVAPLDADFLYNDKAKKKRTKKQHNKATSTDDPPTHGDHQEDKENYKKKAFDELATAVDGVKKMYAEALSDADKSKSTVSEGRITKRKRVRIRKGKKAGQTDAESPVAPPHPRNAHSLMLLKVNSHVRFPPPETTLPVTVLRNITQNGDEKPRIVRALPAPRSDSDCDSDSDVSTHCEPVNQSKPELSVILNTLDKFPVTAAIPNNDDIVLFKMLKMDTQYNPVVSGPILGKVCSVCPQSSLIKFSILDGHSECATPNGKFDLDDESPTALETIDIIWNQLIEPRKI